MSPSVELVSTGAELLSGRTVNTHAQTLARGLADLGLSLVRDTTVPDDRAAIRDAVRDALQRVPLVVVSGGLGPTSDDVTRDAVAELLGVSIKMHEPTREAIRQRYARTQRVWSEKVARHALILDGAEVLDNRAGLAPGELIRWNGKMIFLLPGPPSEFEAVLTDHVIPRLRALAGAPPLQHLLQITGIGESDIIRLLPEEEFPDPQVDVAYCASPGRVEVRLQAAPVHAEALTRSLAMARQRLGEWIYAETRVNLEQVVVDALLANRRTLAVAESCTGGLVGHRLTQVPGSSAVFLGGVVAYSNAMKTGLLGVPAELIARVGAVSAEVAEALAQGVRRISGADLGLGITGIAGPGGATEQKPVGLVYIAISDAAGVRVREFRFAGSRDTIKTMSAQMALDVVRRRLAGRT